MSTSLTTSDERENTKLRRSVARGTADHLGRSVTLTNQLHEPAELEDLYARLAALERKGSGTSTLNLVPELSTSTVCAVRDNLAASVAGVDLYARIAALERERRGDAAQPRQELSVLEPITVTVAQARRISGLGHTTIYKMIKAGDLEVVKIGARTLITYISLKKRLGRAA
jgi:hypothetical protein